jgi:hypothetical protein
VKNEIECGRKRTWQHPGICMEELRITREIIDRVTSSGVNSRTRDSLILTASVTHLTATVGEPFFKTHSCTARQGITHFLSKGSVHYLVLKSLPLSFISGQFGPMCTVTVENLNTYFTSTVLSPKESRPLMISNHNF